MLGTAYRADLREPVMAEDEVGPRSFTMTIRLDRGVYIALDQFCDDAVGPVSKNAAVNALVAEALKARGYEIEKPPVDGRKKRWERARKAKDEEGGGDG